MARVNMADGLRAAQHELLKQAGGAGQLLDAAKGALGGVDLGRAAMHGGGTGVGVGIIDKAIDAFKAYGMSPVQQRAALRAGGSTADVLKGMQGALKRNAKGGFAPLGQQGFGRLANAAGRILPSGAARGAAIGATGHAVGQAIGQGVISHQAAQYMPYAAGAAGLGGYLATKN